MWMIGLTQTWRENEAQLCFHVNLIKSLFSINLYQHLPAIKSPQQRSFKTEVFIEHVEEGAGVMAKKKKEKWRGDATSLDEQSSEGSKKRSFPAVSAQIVSISTMCKWKGGMRAFFLIPLQRGTPWRDQGWCQQSRARTAAACSIPECASEIKTIKLFVEKLNCYLVWTENQMLMLFLVCSFPHGFWLESHTHLWSLQDIQCIPL